MHSQEARSETVIKAIFLLFLNSNAEISQPPSFELVQGCKRTRGGRLPPQKKLAAIQLSSLRCQSESEAIITHQGSPASRAEVARHHGTFQSHSRPVSSCPVVVDRRRHIAPFRHANGRAQQEKYLAWYSEDGRRAIRIMVLLSLNAYFNWTLTSTLYTRSYVREGCPVRQRPFGRRRPGWPLDHATT